MDNFFDAIKRFVKANQDNDYRGSIYFLWNDTKISYCVAEDIVNTLICHELNDTYAHERIEELEDYNRLLRKENLELKSKEVKDDTIR